MRKDKERRLSIWTKARIVIMRLAERKSSKTHNTYRQTICMFIIAFQGASQFSLYFLGGPSIISRLRICTVQTGSSLIAYFVEFFLYCVWEVFLQRCSLLSLGMTAVPHIRHKINVSQLEKCTFWHVRTTKTQIRLRIRAVWSESPLFAWWFFISFAIHIPPSENSDRTVQMCRLICVIAGRICEKVHYLALQPN